MPSSAMRSANLSPLAIVIVAIVMTESGRRVARMHAVGARYTRRVRLVVLPLVGAGGRVGRYHRVAGVTSSLSAPVIAGTVSLDADL